MTSAINPNNINTAYPVAGQDNNTKGFRDNFTNIKNNFVSAAAEISDLQNKVVVTGSDAVNNFDGGLIFNAEIRDLSTSTVDLGNPVSGPVHINYAIAPYQYLKTSGNIIVTFDTTSFPSSGQYGVVYLEIEVEDPAHTVTFPTAVTENTQGIQGFDITSNTITFSSAGTYTFELSIRFGGSAGSGFVINEVNKKLQPFNNSSEDLAASAAANLSLTTSYFTTAAAETATLAAGVEGQIKVFAMVANDGDMVITVNNAGWKTSGTGTVTFNAVGNACTFQYINTKWFCIGNNGGVFA